MKSFARIVLGLAMLAVIFGLGALLLADRSPLNGVSSFDECAAAGFPIRESYPAQCSAGDKIFAQDIGNELDLQDIIIIDTPRPTQKVTSPLTITGQARGPWFFEASFGVKLLNDNGQLLAQTAATTSDDWMTEEFIDYSAVLEFTPGSAKTGTLILEKANPSGLPENDANLRVPVKFE